MGETSSKDNGIAKRPLYVETDEIQSRLPELLICLFDGETVVIRHHGKNIGYLMPRDEGRERELRELAEASAERFREAVEKWPKTRMTKEEVAEPAQTRE